MRALLVFVAYLHWVLPIGLVTAWIVYIVLTSIALDR
jgi:hypothetical protein